MRPAFYDLPDTSVAYGDTLWLRIRAFDPEGEEITYGVEPIMTWGDIKAGYVVQAVIDARTGDFWFSPGDRDIPLRTFRFTAEDAQGGYMPKTVDVSVR